MGSGGSGQGNTNQGVGSNLVPSASQGTPDYAGQSLAQNASSPLGTTLNSNPITPGTYPAGGGQQQNQGAQGNYYQGYQGSGLAPPKTSQEPAGGYQPPTPAASTPQTPAGQNFEGLPQQAPAATGMPNWLQQATQQLPAGVQSAIQNWQNANPGYLAQAQAWAAQNPNTAQAQQWQDAAARAAQASSPPGTIGGR